MKSSITIELWTLTIALALSVTVGPTLTLGKGRALENCPIPAHHPDFSEVQHYYPLSKYAASPEKVRCLMQYADIESDICKGTYHGALTERACRRSDQMMERIERAGWCWESYTATSADDHWMKCGDSPGYAYQHGLTPKRGYDDPNVPAPHEK